jgi:hypothetical protein
VFAARIGAVPNAAACTREVVPMTPAFHRTAAAILLSAGVPAAAEAQQPAQRMDIVHCFVSEPVVTEGPERAYRLQSFLLRGVTRSSEPGGAFDNGATRCVGHSVGIGQTSATSRGVCEVATSSQDRVVLEWILQAGEGTGRFIAGTGRYAGVTGDVQFRQLPPVPVVEQGHIRSCNRTAGDFRLP